MPADRFEHEALFYRGDADFLAGLLPFIRDGLERDEAVVVAEPRPRLDLLRDALGADAAAVEFLDMAEIGANPARIIGVWADALDRHTAAGRRLRGVGEPAFAGRRDRPSCRVPAARAAAQPRLRRRARAGGCSAPTTRSTCRAR